MFLYTEVTGWQAVLFWVSRLQTVMETVQINWSPGWHKQMLQFWVHSCDNTTVHSRRWLQHFQLLMQLSGRCWLLWNGRVCSSHLISFCPVSVSLSTRSAADLGSSCYLLRPHHWGWWRGCGWLLTSQSAGHRSWTWKLSGSVGTSWWFFLLHFLFFFLAMFKNYSYYLCPPWHICKYNK